MIQLESKLRDAFNFDLSVMSSVTVLLAKALSSFHFKGDHFITHHQIVHDLSLHSCFNLLTGGNLTVFFEH